MSKRYDLQNVVEKMGGRFQLAAILEKRYKELLFGDRPLVKIDSNDPMDIMFEEIMQDKIELIPEAEAIAAATAALMADAEKTSDTTDARHILGLDDEDGENVPVEKDILKDADVPVAQKQDEETVKENEEAVEENND